MKFINSGSLISISLYPHTKESLGFGRKSKLYLYFSNMKAIDTNMLFGAIA